MIEPTPLPQRSWSPTEEEMQSSELIRLMQSIGHGTSQDYHQFYTWSVEHLEEFWEACLQFFEIPLHTKAQKVLIRGNHMSESKWFVGATLNYSEALLQNRSKTPALISIREDKESETMDFSTLYEEVRSLHFWLREQGIGKGDVVAGYLPNTSATITAFLAAASLGAIWTSCSTDFGIDVVCDRFMQVRPRLLVTVNATLYKGKVFPLEQKLTAILERIPTIATVLEVHFCKNEKTLQTSLFKKHTPQLQTWAMHHEVLATWHEKTQTKEIDFVALPFDHPLYILYTSGTTGKPKCIVHRAGGCLLKHLTELSLHLNLKTEERMLFFTTCGWMMWNWQVSALALGVTLLLYEGAPFSPHPTHLLEQAAKHRIHVLGAGAAYYHQLKVLKVDRQTLEPYRQGLDQLRTLLSTGSPLSENLFTYLHEILGKKTAGNEKRIQIASISGGTDIVGCFVLSCPLIPVYKGEIQTRALGVAVQVFNDDHQAVSGEKGELVCTEPFPSMPLYFHADHNNARYREAYFHTLDHVWFQGDFAEITQHGGIIIYGRSDNTLNPNGVRIGTAELYKHLESIDAITQAAAVTHDQPDNIRLILFVVLREGLLLTHELKKHISNIIKEKASPRHVPNEIIAVPDLPRTINGKIAEKAIKHALHHQNIRNASTLANPEILTIFKQLEGFQ